MRDQCGLHEFRDSESYCVVQKWWQKQSLSSGRFELGNHEESWGGPKLCRTKKHC